MTILRRDHRTLILKFSYILVKAFLGFPKFRGRSMKFWLTKLILDPFQWAIDDAILTNLCTHALGKNTWSRKKFIHAFIAFHFSSKRDFRGVWHSPPRGQNPKMRLPLSTMTKTKSMDQIWGPNSTTPFPSLFEFLVPLLLSKVNFSVFTTSSFITIRNFHKNQWKVAILLPFWINIMISTILVFATKKTKFTL